MKILERLRLQKPTNPTNSKEYKKLEQENKELAKDWAKLKDLRKATDDIFLKMANVLGVKDKKTYDNIYSAFEKKLGKPKKG